MSPGFAHISEVGGQVFSAFNSDQVFLLHLYRLAYLGDEHVQDAILKLPTDVLLLYFVANIKAAATGTNEPLPAQVMLILRTIGMGRFHRSTDAEIAVLQFGGETVPGDTGQVDD